MSLKHHSSKHKKSAPRTCFVVMPISDAPTYDAGHFQLVYEHLIIPSCKKAGFEPVRADDVKVTNFIIIDVLKTIVTSDMVLCDLSSRNPNVLYELGIRHAFDLPVTLIRDLRTPRMFDIQGLRDIEFDESLRIDKIEQSIKQISTSLQQTARMEGGDVNSLIRLLAIPPAKLLTADPGAQEALLAEKHRMVIQDALLTLVAGVEKIKQVVNHK